MIKAERLVWCMQEERSFCGIQQQSVHRALKLHQKMWCLGEWMSSFYEIRGRALVTGDKNGETVAL